MSAPPKVFISATSDDLRSARKVVEQALIKSQCLPVEQSNFHPDWRTLEDLDRKKIEECQALIHLVGWRYGAEPDPDALPPGTPRRSYTQLEYHVGRRLQTDLGDPRFRVYVFLCPQGFPFDPEPEAEPEEKRALQIEHRRLLERSPYRYDIPADDGELEKAVLAMREEVFAIQQEQEEVRTEVRRARKSILGVLTVVLLLVLVLGGGIYAVHRYTQRGFHDIVESQKIDTAKIKTHLRESSERRLEQDLQAADLEAKSEARERLKDNAQAAHQSRIARIDEFAANFALIEGRTDATEEVKEMRRILQEEGVDAALRYIEGKRAALLARVAAADAAHVEQRRAQLQPLLQAAGLQRTKGQTAAARASYQQLLKLDPHWPQALGDYAWFLFDQSEYFRTTGPLSAAVTDAQQCLAHSQRFHDLDPTQARAQRVLSAAHNQMSDVLTQRGAKGDADENIQHCQQSLALAEALYRAAPNSEVFARDVSVSLEKLGDFLAQRGQPGDAEAALKNYQREVEICEKLLAANPDSGEAARDVSISLVKLGGFLTQRGQPGDAEAALKHCTRSLELAEKLRAANPDSAQAARDVSVSLNKLGDFLAQRGQPGDAEAALKHYTRDLEMSEKLLAANPDSAQAVRDVSVSLNKLGDFIAKRGQPGDAETALKRYTRSLELAEKLLAANPDSGQAARDVSVSLNKLGGFLAQRGQPGDAETALKHYARGLEMSDKLLAANPDSGQAVRDVSVSLNKLGDFLAQRGQPGDAEAALKHYTRSLEQREKLLVANPDSGEAALDVAISHERLGDFARDSDNPAEAEAHYRHSLDTWDRLSRANPGSAYYSRGGMVPASRLAALAETTGKGDAQVWWQRAHDILDGMVRQGMTVSPQDMGFLETLRAKVSAK